ncbi:hypothetical protein [Agrococcus terreus]|uniref:DUF3558 domain-containing protein n=1 Tax=Agrococcus terreus TaxID=574649 RepID=A0ABQ2KFA5_9MICO|nr:hypothetical protein [Agrococcus terreus]GGN80011.1 hypothetical protein GCM10010968_07500 [Agrococcus terreus]
MPRSSIRIAAIAIGALVVAGCTTTAADPGVTPIATPDASHTMPDGSTMEGAEHGDHHAQEGDGSGPSAAAEMVCGGQVDTAVKLIVGAPDMPEPSTAWTAPEFTCTFDVDGAPLVLEVHDATDPAEGQAHFDALQSELGADTIEGLQGLGLPSFSTHEGVVAFLRDGKTLLVDATALPADVGGDRTLDGVAYAVASAVLTCWVAHD